MDTSCKFCLKKGDSILWLRTNNGLVHYQLPCPPLIDLQFLSLVRRFDIVCLFVGCLTSQQQASVSQGRICSDNFTCCHTETEVADRTFYLTQSQYTDTGLTSPNTDPITPGAWQGSHWSANFEVTGMTRPRKKSRHKRDSNQGPSALDSDPLPLGQRGGLGSIYRCCKIFPMDGTIRSHPSSGRMTQPSSPGALLFFLLCVVCLTSQQHTSVSQARICSDSSTCCHTEIEVADQTCHLTQPHYTDTGPTSLSAGITL